MNLFFDTETTGFPRRDLPLDHPRQPRIVQLACILAEDDGTERASLSLIVRPDGWSIPAEAAAIHGIDDALAERAGVPIDMALRLLLDMARQTSLVVAHNVAFDVEVAQIGLHQIRQPDAATEIGAMPRACTMNLATPILKLPPTERMLAAGFNKPKAPKLAECVRHFFDEPLEGAHDALVDVRACARVYRHLMTMERTAV